MAELLPNFALLKSPMNWFLVAFAVFILAMITHFMYKEKM